MAEMPAIARFFVNRSADRRSARFAAWIRTTGALPRGGVLLEVGCGNGRLASRCVRELAVARYVATDVDPRQVAEAVRSLRADFGGSLPDAVSVARADMTRLGYPDASFDGVVASVALHHAGASHRAFAGVPRGLAEIDRVLRPGGRVVYSEMFHRREIRDWFAARAYRSVAHRRGWRLDYVALEKPAAASGSTSSPEEAGVAARPDRPPSDRPGRTAPAPG